MRSYSKLPKNITGLVGLFSLYQRHRRRIAGELPALVDETNQAIAKMESLLGRKFAGLKILDIGPGPFLLQSYILGLQNDVTAMDLDVLAIGSSPIPYLRMLRKNGPFRTMKTIARKSLGIDREYRRQLALVLNARPLPRIKVIQGDITRSTLPDASFQAAHCRALFQHIPDPESATREIIRLLTPGGVLYISLQLYTSFNGSLDPRVAAGVADESMHWAHLRPSLRDSIQSNSYLNKWRLAEWIALFSRLCPGHIQEIENSKRDGIPQAAHRLIASGDLPGYTADELCAHTLNIFWKKPV
jgi:SAM-dependent methyltransferase